MPDIPVTPPRYEPSKEPAKPAEKSPEAKPQPPVKDEGSKPGSADYHGGFGDQASAANTAKRKKLLADIEKQLAATGVQGGKKRESADLFVIGTIEVLNDHHGNMEFEIVEGLKATAAKLVDFLLKEKALVRKWDVFARTKTLASAQKQLALAKSKSIEGRVAVFPMKPPNRRFKISPDDSFVVGTADLRLSNSHADVRFRVIKQRREVVSFLLDYVLAAPKGIKRDWNVFYRTHTEAEADKLIAQLRIDYDNLEQQRDAIAKIYAAATTLRC